MSERLLLYNRRKGSIYTQDCSCFIKQLLSPFFIVPSSWPVAVLPPRPLLGSPLGWNQTLHLEWSAAPNGPLWVG